MDTPIQELPGPYVWSAPGHDVIVHLDIGVLERMGIEIMRGFGAVPKRGAEVGGLLLGTIQEGKQPIVRIEDFAPVACHYRRGPSYLLADEDGRAFSDACSQWGRGAGKRVYAVGYYRSNTRDGFNFSSEDAELMNHYFHKDSDVALLVRPSATGASVAGFFVRDQGVFPETTPLQFPFRRRELTGEAPPAHRPITAGRRERVGPELLRIVPRVDTAPAPSPNPPIPQAPLASTVDAPAKRPFRWFLPMSFMFLMLGVGLGFLSALFVGPKMNGVVTAQDFSLSLSAVKAGDNLTVRWNRNSAPVRAAQRAVLEIDDGDSSPAPVHLDLAHLETGSMIYRNSTKTVRFRLMVYETSHVTVTESTDWQE
jgi:hypothetical protein